MSESTVELTDALVVDGVRIGRYRLRDQPVTAELFKVEVSTADAADAVVASMGGWALTTTDTSLVDELLARGAMATRRYSLMSLPLDVTAATAAEGLGLRDLATVPLTVDTEVTPGVVDLIRQAYPAGHPDQETGSDDDVERAMHRILEGEWLGPLHPASRLVIDGERPVAMIILNRPEGSAPVGGLWLSEICRIPDAAYAGLGADLLLAVLAECRQAGEQALSLAVTDGNPARRMYERLGFETAMSITKLIIPG